MTTTAMTPDDGIYLTRVDKGADWPEFVYLTRDADEDTGRVSSVVEVWDARPEPSRPVDQSGPGCCFFASVDGALLGRYSLDAARAYFRTVPDSDREVVRCPS